MERIAGWFWNFFRYGKERYIFAVMIFTAVILRLHTAFIDFIHVDVITTYLTVKDQLAGLSVNYNKGPLYHWLMKFSITHIADTPKSFHAIGILFVVLTCIAIWRLGNVLVNSRVGLLAGILYGAIISSYHTGYLATNGEVVYNLFFVLSFLSFYKIVYQKKYIYSVLLVLSLICAVSVKFQGSFALFVLIFYFVVIYPLSIFHQKRRRVMYYCGLFGCVLVLSICVFVDFSITHFALNDSVRGKIILMYKYASNKGASPIALVSKLALRIYQFSLFHGIIWIPGIYAVIRFFKTKQKCKEETFIVSLVILLFGTVFLGGVRLFTHYFIPMLAPLAILASTQIFIWIDSASARKKLFLIFIIPVIFWFSWNIRDFIMYQWKNNWKYNEGSAMYAFRTVVTNDLGEYLIPQKSLLPVINYLKNETPVKSTVLVWPMGAEVVYYSKRQPVVSNYWYNESALYALTQREKGNLVPIAQTTNNIVLMINEKKPDYFIDVGNTPMIRKTMMYHKKNDPPMSFDIHSIPMVTFGHYGSLDDFPEVISFLKMDYVQVGTFGDARVWKKVK